MNTAYNKALAYILSRTDLERRTDMSGARAELGLERMRALLDKTGRPETAYWTVHVAGTKGKGSTSAMLERVLRCAGLRTGLYTSPHLHTFRERIRLNGRCISEADLASLTTYLCPIADAMPDRPSTFEIITALALTSFAQRGVDVAVLEVGLGGRLDATNVVTPRVSVITSISFDHMAVLGNTLAAIAAEKAGIIKPGVPVVSSPQHPEALEVIERVCAEQGAPLALVGRDVQVTVTAASRAGSRAIISGPGYEHHIRIPLMGEHQATNAAVAVAALETLRGQGLSLTDTQIRFGLFTVRWPGRLEIVARNPFIVVDGAHNVDSAQKLRAALDRFFPRQGDKACLPRVLVMGMSADKDVDGIMQALVPGADAIVLTRANHPRAASLERLQAAAAAYTSNIYAAPDVPGALATARELVGDSGVICATGSLFIVADVRALIKGLHQEILPAV